MSLLNDFAKPCVLLEKRTTADGEGGYITEWVEGVTFENFQATESSLEARIAEKQGVTSVYNVLVKRDLPLEYHSVFRDKESGKVFRVTSDPEDKKAPRSASFDLKFCTAERWDLPK